MTQWGSRRSVRGQTETEDFRSGDARVSQRKAVPTPGHGRAAVGAPAHTWNVACATLDIQPRISFTSCFKDENIHFFQSIVIRL